MKLCWDILNKHNFRLAANGTLRSRLTNNSYYIHESCSTCGNPFLGALSTSRFCDKRCANLGENNSMHSMVGNKNPFYGKKHTSETRARISAKHHNVSGKNNPNWKGNVRDLNVPLYETFSKQLEPIEKTYKVHKNGLDLLAVTCTYCGKIFIPSLKTVTYRIHAINSLEGGECRLYCSDGCKKACPTFGKKLWPAGFKRATSREVQAELRQLVLARDDYRCQICYKSVEEVELHCHHITGIAKNPIESADMDNCISLCKQHHMKVHSKSGCKFHELRCS